MVTSYSRELMLGIPQGTLIDIETTGLNIGQDEIVLFGYIQGSHLEIICRSSREETPFIAQLAELVLTLPRPFYAYNLAFEKGFLQAKGIEIEGIDLFRPWKEILPSRSFWWPTLPSPKWSTCNHWGGATAVQGLVQACSSNFRRAGSIWAPASAPTPPHLTAHIASFSESRPSSCAQKPPDRLSAP